MVVFKTGRSSCKLVVFHDECWLRCSTAKTKWYFDTYSWWMSNEMLHNESKVVLVHEIKSEDVPWHTKWLCPWLEGHVYWYLSMTNVEWDVPIKCKVVLVPDIKSVDVTRHTKWWCLWLGRSCKLVLSLKECRTRCSHQIQSSTSPRHEVRRRSLTTNWLWPAT
jgi:hypothetical protein